MYNYYNNQLDYIIIVDQLQIPLNITVGNLWATLYFQ